MIVFRYSKTDGAEFISHLDTLRHLCKTFARGKIPVKLSQGFHPHMLIYMSSPIGVGLVSYAEYCTVETDINPEDFKEIFNASSPKGIKCTEAYYSPKNINLAAVITRAKYYIEGLNHFDTKDILRRETFELTDKRGNLKDVRDKIFDLRRRGNGYEAVLAAGNVSLRADVFAGALKQQFGGEHVVIVKEESYVDSGDRVETLIN